MKSLGGERPLSRIVATLKASIAHRCRLAGVSLEWQHGYYDRIVREYERSDEFVKYVLLNPVRAGLVVRFEDYPYAGLVDAWH